MGGLPTFFVLGAMKCGTTSLYRLLDQHPDVFFSEPKEPIFFEAHYERGLDFYRDTYFANWSGQSAVGDARTHHLFLEFVAPLLAEHFPEARLVAILRDPVARAYSHWWHRTTRGLETLGFTEAIAANRREQSTRPDAFAGVDGRARWKAGMLDEHTARIRPRLYLELGEYAVQIERFRNLFSPDQLKVVLFEDLASNPVDTTRSVWEFIGVDPDQPLADPTPQNVAGARVRSPLAARMLHWPGQDAARQLLPNFIRDRLRRFLAGRPAHQPSMDSATEADLLAHFAPHNRALSALIERELPAWDQPDARRRRESVDAD